MLIPGSYRWRRRHQRRKEAMAWPIPAGYSTWRDGRWWRASCTYSRGLTLPIEPLSDFNKYQAREAIRRHYTKVAGPPW